MPIRKDKDGLTAKQAAFVREYMIDLNASQAALRAGYSKKTAFRAGQENMQKPAVLAALQKKMDARAKKTEITAEYVLKTIHEITEKCKAEDDAKNALKGAELLGKHLKLFTDKIQGDVGGKLVLSWQQSGSGGDDDDN